MRVGFLIALYLSSALAALPTISNLTCSNDDDCSLLNQQLPGWAYSKSAGYLCVLQPATSVSKCTYKVAAGELCSAATDCAVAEYISRAQRSGSTFTVPPVISSNISGYLSTLCAPQYCSIQSTCDSSSDPLFPTSSSGSIEYPAPFTCCGGAPDTWPCAKMGQFLDSCASDEVCTAANGASTCVSINAKSQQWIGIVLTLMGAATLNVGLNLQKLALRKRNEKIQEKKAEARSRFRTLARGTFRFTWSKASMGRARTKSGSSSRFNPNGTPDTYPLTPTIERPALPPSSLLQDSNMNTIIDDNTQTDGPDSDINSSAGTLVQATIVDDFDKSIEPPQPYNENDNIPLAIPVSAQPSTSNGASVVGTEMTSNNYPPGESAQPNAQLQADDVNLQTKLNFGNLFQNPTWILGLAVFIGGNIINFVALQFAPQSLVAPLGSISLVVNVIVAPWINKERWGWKDIVGVIMIVGGSSMVVAFSGVASKDYKLCVLLVLFSATNTIVFLTVTGGLILTLYFMICIVEKNVDFGVPGATARALTKEGHSSYAVLMDRVAASRVSTSGTTTSAATFDSRHNLLRNPAQRALGLFNHRSHLPSSFLSHPAESATTTVTPAAAAATSQRPSDTPAGVADPITASKAAASYSPFASTFSESTTSVEPTTAPSSPTASTYHLSEWVKHPNDPRTWPRPYRNLHTWWHSIDILPRFSKKIPLSSPWVVLALPFTYASLGGLMGTITVLFAKSTSYLLSISFTGNNQFNNFFAFLITGITVVTAIGQVYWINMGLQRYDALLQIPVYFVVWTLFDVVGGGIYFDEFNGFTALQYTLFILGVAVIFSGVIVLADRLKRIEVDDQMISNANLNAQIATITEQQQALQGEVTGASSSSGSGASSSV
ncbi:hypothetical protein SmJEL517_g04323 [Synchytrium microbalum]|uniref:Magnesium transporter NIPA n=1 Tax=Synchytrium microbalum TaxID=1806994 RepID=A0A507BYU6_9FUNG|nr:uncharacterized protein SmJEL517_g04323 [Synchytrium microbalum]TPX32602.1 hypothetical protein SmJEL517_g04323 [Synchytrium microbalum]